MPPSGCERIDEEKYQILAQFGKNLTVGPEFVVASVPTIS
jgi:hypothetical protein